LDFFRERGGYVVENENGWCNYYIQNNTAYLENLYVYPEKRQKQLGTSLLSVFEMELQELHNINIVLTTISLTLGRENAEKTLGIALKRGFKFYGSDASAIILKKEL
jgi:GNAT superfamily N-acetyltransferase